MNLPDSAVLEELDNIAADAGRDATLAALGRALAQRDGEEGARAARILFLGILNLNFTAIVTDPRAPVPVHGLKQLRAAARRYLAGEPPGRILGQRGFWGLEFGLGPDTLEPRPDTETLVETALRDLAEARSDGVLAEHDGPLRIVDLGCGTGCILVALLSELPDAMGIGVDLAPGAAKVARSNALANGVGTRSAFIAGDWASALAGAADQGGGFDLLVSNPPYIPHWTLDGLAANVRFHDPVLALDGGSDGLRPYGLLAPEAIRLLRPGGVAAFEVGVGQAATVAGMMRNAGLGHVRVTEDLSGVMRVVSGRRRKTSGQRF